MSLCNEHRFLVSITSKSLQHTISMSGHDAFSASDNNSASNSPSNAPARFEFLIPNLFVWHFSFWTQLQKNTIWIMIWMKYSSNSTEVGIYIIQNFYIAMKFEMEFMTKFEILELNLHYIVVYLQYSNWKVNNMNVLTFKYLLVPKTINWKIRAFWFIIAFRVFAKSLLILILNMTANHIWKGLFICLN